VLARRSLVVVAASVMLIAAEYDELAFFINHNALYKHSLYGTVVAIMRHICH
jgi:hypothetical protein